MDAFLATHPLTKHRRLPAMARVLRWQVASRIQDEVIVHWIGGTRLAARRGMTGLTGNIYAGLHEFADMAFVLHFLRPCDLFVDVDDFTINHKYGFQILLILLGFPDELHNVGRGPNVDRQAVRMARVTRHSPFQSNGLSPRRGSQVR
jgi:hypothetical protein